MKRLNFKLRNVLVVISMIIMANNLLAQEKNDIKLLIGKEWVVQLPSEKKGVSYRFRYTTNERISILIVGDQTVELKSLYYLSDEIPQKFDDQKVGLPGMGKYIVTHSKVRNAKKETYMEMNVFEILELTETDLKIKSLRSNLIIDHKVKESE